MSTHPDLHQLAARIKQWGRELGFQQVGICDTDLSAEEPKLQAWLDAGYQGDGLDGTPRHDARAPA